jgi:hypothetical protein
MSGTVPFQTGAATATPCVPSSIDSPPTIPYLRNTVTPLMAKLGRPKGSLPPRATHSFRLPLDIAEQLEELRWQARKSKSQIVTEALRAHLPRLMRKVKGSK